MEKSLPLTVPFYSLLFVFFCNPWPSILEFMLSIDDLYSRTKNGRLIREAVCIWQVSRSLSFQSILFLSSSDRMHAVESQDISLL